MRRFLSGLTFFPGNPVNVYPFIEAGENVQAHVKRASELLKVSRVAFHEYLSGPPRRQEDTELAAEIQAVHEDSKRTLQRAAGQYPTAPPRPP